MDRRVRNTPHGTSNGGKEGELGKTMNFLLSFLFRTEKKKWKESNKKSHFINRDKR